MTLTEAVVVAPEQSVTLTEASTGPLVLPGGMVKVPVRDCWSKLTVPPEPVTLQLVHAQVSVKVNGTTTGASLQNAFDPVTGWPLGAAAIRFVGNSGAYLAGVPLFFELLCRLRLCETTP